MSELTIHNEPALNVFEQLAFEEIVRQFGGRVLPLVDGGNDDEEVEVEPITYPDKIDPSKRDKDDPDNPLIVAAPTDEPDSDKES